MKISKIISYFVIVIGIVLSLFLGCSKQPSNPNLKIVEGVGKGRNGDIVVDVSLDNNKIVDIKIKKHEETAGIGDPAIERIPKAIIDSQSTNVDAVSGATMSSNGIKEAVENALEKEGIKELFQAEAVAEAVDNSNQTETIEADVVVVGAGGAGMVSAIVAAQNGKNVCLIDSQPMVGGNTVRSTGGLNAAKTTWQDSNQFDEEAGLLKTLDNAKNNYSDNQDIMNLVDIVTSQYEDYKSNKNGYFDSQELMELDTMVGGKAKNNFNLVKALCEKSEDAIKWLDGIGATLHNVAAFGGASVKRIHRPLTDDGKVASVGAYLVPILDKNVLKYDNINLILDTNCDKIIMKDGVASGVEGTKYDGTKVIVNAKSVILATGGFGANLDMVASYQPSLKGFMTTNAPGAKGEGIIMAQAVGADVVDMDQIQIHPTVEANTASLITEGLRGDGAILINSNGKRFIDEVGTRDVVSKAEIAQPGSFSWLIVDNKMYEASNVIQGYVKRDFAKIGNSYEELATELEIDPATLTETMNTWNECVANKEDKEFNRTSFANPLDTAPFYAIKVTAGIHHTMGGLVINENAEVLDTNGNKINGLYACGEVTGGIHGANRLGGNAVADIIVFGKIAGESVVDFLNN